MILEVPAEGRAVPERTGVSQTLPAPVGLARPALPSLDYERERDELALELARLGRSLGRGEQRFQVITYDASWRRGALLDGGRTRQ